MPTATGWASAARRPPARSRQRGAILVMYTLGALAIVGMAGLALDMGMVYLTKTRLQNALDAAALDGAKTLYFTHSQSQASAAALTTLGKNITLAGGTTLFEASPTQSPFDPGGLDPRYVRVRVADLPVPTYLTRVLGMGSAFNIGGSAMAGPQPRSGTLCGAVPVALCGSTGSGDSDCTDSECFGIDGTVEMTMKSKASIGPGNYGLVDFDCTSGGGAACVRKGMAGGENHCFTAGEEVTTEPGVATGPVADGVNTRFGIEGPQLPASQYPSDLVTVPSLYPAYLTLLENKVWDHPGGVAKRRVMLVPIIDCTTPISGKSEVDVLGSACMFLTRQSPTTGPTKGEVYAQMVSTCRVEGGVPDPDPPAEPGPSQIVLFQSSTES